MSALVKKYDHRQDAVQLQKFVAKYAIYQAGRLTKTMYQLNYQTPKTHRRKSVILQMDSEQQELYDIVSRNAPEE